MLNVLFVGIGGFAGAVLRYLLGQIPVGNTSGFPLITLLINVSGAFVIGMIASLAAKNTSFDPRLVLLLKTGFCGGFTTFSTFSLETAELIEHGSAPVAVIYILLSVILCTAAVFVSQLIFE